MIPENVNNVQLEGTVWGTALDEKNEMLYLDVRNEKLQSLQLIRIELNNSKLETNSADYPWWSKMVSADERGVYFVEYKDQNDPNNQSFFSVRWDEMRIEGITNIPNQSTSIVDPQVYEHGTEYHKTVAAFLSLELPLSCEYLEWSDKIIISYYLRSGNGFDRYLLVLADGQKVWKVKQDTEMKGFSLGAFFVFENQLIFIKERNEVCVYTG